MIFLGWYPYGINGNSLIPFVGDLTVVFWWGMSAKNYLETRADISQ
jgi:hypothetical protein